MKILFAAAEAAPIAKVGGMADVVGTLPPVLRQQGLDVRIIMPFYGFLWLREELADCVKQGPIWTARVMDSTCNIYKTVLPETDVPLYLVEHYAFAPHRIYSGEDEPWRFTFFANCVAEFAWNYWWKPNILHCHDWHTGLVPAWMRETSDIGTVFTIHNLAYQGPWRWMLDRMTSLPWYFDARNTMAAGIAYADQVTTVSPTYAREICRPEQGEDLDGLLSSLGLRLHGILNGIDRDRFNPETDATLAKPYSLDTLELRAANKAALQADASFNPNPNAFLLGIVSRLVEQKGIDLALQALERFLAYSDAQLVILGSGNPYYEGKLQELSDRWGDRVTFFCGFDAQLAQRIYAGADAFLMPSRFEPCGISQMIALRYGCVPIVRRTGGLVDTVSHHSPIEGTGTGYCFDRYEGLDLYTCMVRAWEGFQYKDAWRALQQRGMAQDFSWARSARDYIKVYGYIMGLDLLEMLSNSSPEAVTLT
ncbi:glycogen synthase GlgA [Synechococcus sp. PCC 7336]|uniref:glycogen synthase GlgA n=1 Tax=Synechococcus sp. PCC 7336 TaxID=195250 RepID=UPI0004757E8D|nr:glycogen synthase GlgA [Synechococcus sp. PCC 7336]